MRRTASTSSSLAALFLALGATACGGRSPHAPPQPASSDTLTAALHASADAWNQGDIDGFLAPYLHGAELTFVGGDGLVRGFEALRARYGAGYFAQGLPDRLGFTDIEVRPLGPGHALMLGRYVLEARAGGAVTSTGIFTLVWGRTPEGWRILHDHTSETGPP
ncbi:MAG TPA: nuclear transport factor 2 family protein [Longimicrobiales bacterium]|nr:nuclear transport factor 2 family protein [Longimicrobiales bacterium]